MQNWPVSMTGTQSGHVSNSSRDNVTRHASPRITHRYIMWTEAPSAMTASDFLFRAAAADDVPALAQLHATTFVETHGGPGPTCAVRSRAVMARGLLPTL